MRPVTPRSVLRSRQTYLLLWVLLMVTALIVTAQIASVLFSHTGLSGYDEIWFLGWL